MPNRTSGHSPNGVALYRIAGSIGRFQEAEKRHPQQLCHLCGIGPCCIRRITGKDTHKQIRLTSKICIYGRQLSQKALRAIIAAGKSLVSALGAGGAIALLVVVVVMLVGILLVSPFGIFSAAEQMVK
mgnify:CR=1 FL=1